LDYYVTVTGKVVLFSDNVIPLQEFMLCLEVSIPSCCNVSAKIVFISFTGMFEYRLVMSNEAKLKCGDIGVNFLIVANIQ